MRFPLQFQYLSNICQFACQFVNPYFKPKLYFLPSNIFKEKMKEGGKLKLFFLLLLLRHLKRIRWNVRQKLFRQFISVQFNSLLIQFDCNYLKQTLFELNPRPKLSSNNILFNQICRSNQQNLIVSNISPFHSRRTKGLQIQLSK